MGYLINEQVLFEEAENAVVLSKADSDNIIFLGEIEALIWKNIFKKSICEIVEILQETYEGDTIQEDVEAFIDELIKHEIIFRM